jgi:CRP/FNR family transcriptional regulator
MEHAHAHAHSFQTSCSACALAGVCLPIAVSGDELDLLDQIIQRKRPIPRNEHVYRANEAFVSLYAVRSGAVKSYRLTTDGEEQIVGFHLPGEIFGLDGLGQSRHGSAAVALESAAVCEIPFARVSELAGQLPGVQSHLLQLMSREISEDQHLLILLSKRTAEERLASFLVGLSSRFRRRKLSPTRFRLPMSRADIGNYLGLVIETVSRVLTRLQRQGIIRLDQREVEIIDLPRLHEVAGVLMPTDDRCD